MGGNYDLIFVFGDMSSPGYVKATECNVPLGFYQGHRLTLIAGVKIKFLVSGASRAPSDSNLGALMRI